MMWTLERVRELQAEIDEKIRLNPYYIPPYNVIIQREVRYYAFINNVRYELAHDWTLEQLERSLWNKDNATKHQESEDLH